MCVLFSEVTVTPTFCWEPMEIWPNTGRTRKNSPSPFSDLKNISLSRVSSWQGKEQCLVKDWVGSGVFLTGETPCPGSVVSRWDGSSSTGLWYSVPVFFGHDLSDTGTWRWCEERGDGSVESGLGVWLDGGGIARSSFWQMFCVIASGMLTGFCSLSDRSHKSYVRERERERLNQP